MEPTSLKGRVHRPVGAALVYHLVDRRIICRMVENAAHGAAPSIVDRLTGKTILLTGVTGFLGQVDLRAAARRCPRGPDRPAGPLRRPAPRRASGSSTCSASRRSTCSAAGSATTGCARSWTSGSRSWTATSRAACPQLPGDIDIAIHSRGDRVVRSADRRGVPDEPVRRHEPVPRRDRQRLAPVPGARLDRVRRRRREGRRPRGHARPPGGLADRGRARAAGAARRGGAVPPARDARRLHGQGVEGALARRSDDRGRRRRAAPQGLGVEAADAATAGRARARSAGPTSTRSRRRWASERSRSSPTSRSCRCRSSGRRSSRARCSTPRPGGSTASRWPTRSSARTGCGQIPEFPGIPEGIVDIIPVDMVVNAILAVAGTPPEPRRPAYYHVSSGSRNPLQYHELYRYVREYFEAHPLPERGRGEHKVPEWSFPGSLSVERMIDRAEQARPTSPTRSSRTCRSPSACATWSRAWTATRRAWSS